MLVLSRRPHEKILIPAIQACIHVTAVQPGVVRVAIDAPREVAILRGEVQDREAEWNPPTEQPREPAVEPEAGTARPSRRKRLTRKGLRVASARLGLARLQLRAGLTDDAQATLDRLHMEIQGLRRQLEVATAPHDPGERQPGPAGRAEQRRQSRKTMGLTVGA